jgi:hypothetical protein
MSTQTPTRRVKNEFLGGLQAFPPEGVNEPFKPLEPVWTDAFPLGCGGENRQLPADQIDPDQAYTLSNFKVNLRDIEPAWGYSAVGSLSAADTPLEINTYKQLDGSPKYLVVIDEDDLNYWNGSAWSVATGTLTGSSTDRIRSAMVLDELVFVNGVDEPKSWTGSATFANLSADSNRPTCARFVVGFADRVILGDIGTGSSRDTQRLDWSASGNIDDFTSDGSGGANLYDSQPGSYADPIMGLLVFGSYLLIPRLNSWWLGVRTGDVNAPINFAPHIVGNGVLAEDSLCVVADQGVAYLGHDNVYLYHPSLQAPIPIGTPIKDRLFSVLDRTKLNKVRCAFVPDTQTYWLLIPDTTNTWGRTAFVFMLDPFKFEQKFVWRERTFSHDISIMGVGQTSGLGASPTEQAKSLLIADSAGNNLYDSDSADTSNGGTAFTSTYESPSFDLGSDQMQLVWIALKYKAGSTATVGISFSTDGGTTYSSADSYSLAASAGPREVILWAPSGIYGRSIMYKITVAGTQDINLLSYKLAYLNRGPIIGT